MLSPVDQRQPQHDPHLTGLTLNSAVEQNSLSFSPDLIPGYTTKDDAGSDGDDTVHSPITFYRVPNCIQSIIKPVDATTDAETVDVVYIDFIQPWILLAFRFLGLEYSEADTHAYMYGESLTTLLAEWVTTNWQDNCK